LRYETRVQAVADEGDPIGQIPELNENNNTRTEMVHIRMPDPALPYSALPISPEYPFSDSTVTISPVITNEGDADASNIAVHMWVEDDQGTPLNWQYNTTINSLAAGASQSLSSNVSLSAFGTGPGEYTFFAVVDPNSTLKEINEENNLQIRTVYALAPPTLTLEDGAVDCLGPKCPRQGDNVRVDVVIRNAPNGAAATNVQVNFDDVLNGSDQWSQGTTTQINYIGAGDIESTHNYLQNVPQGTRRVRITVTYTDEEPQRQVQFTLPDFEVRWNLPDLEVTDLTISQENPPESTTPTFTIEISNNGEQDWNGGSQVGLYYTLNGVPWTDAELLAHHIGTKQIGIIPQGSSITRQIQWSPPDDDHYVVVAWVDPNDNVVEVWDDSRRNQKWMNVNVQNGPNLSLGRVWTEPRNPITDQTTRIWANVANLGDQAATFDVGFYLEDEDGNQTNIADVNQVVLDAYGGGSTNFVTDVWVDWTPSEGGLFKIIAIADPEGAVPESPNQTFNNTEDTMVRVKLRPFSTTYTGGSIFVDHLEGAGGYEAELDGNQAKVVVVAKANRDCYWENFWYHCDYEDSARIRMTRYKTFDVNDVGGGVDSALADITADLTLLGVMDTSVDVPFFTDSYWSVKIDAGICQGTPTTAKLDAAPEGQVVNLFDEDSDNLLGSLALGAVVKAIQIPCKLGVCKLLEAVLSIADFVFVDTIMVAEGQWTLPNVTLETNQTYSFYISVDIYAEAEELDTLAYVDFWFHENIPNIDLLADYILDERGIWLRDIEVNFK